MYLKKVILGPMAGVNNIAFRKLCTEHGADIVYSQMIDANAFLMGNYRMVDFVDEKNVVAQFFGNEPETIAGCAQAVEDKVQAIDINLGCPHSNVVKRKCGAYLMKFPRRISQIIKALKKNVSIPITVKIRAGFDRNNINAVEIAKICEKEGIAAIAIHGRARTVNYEQAVDYEIIKKVKDAVSIPIIGNGDIFSGKDAKTMFEKTNCDSIMIGRAAIGNPQIFHNIKHYLKSGKTSKKGNYVKTFKKFLKYCKRYKVEFKEIKKHAQWLTKGAANGGKCRKLMNNAKSTEELAEIYGQFQ